MNKIITHLDLDLASSNEYKIINAQQLDNNTRRLEVNLFHEGKIYDISNVTRIELQGQRGDKLPVKTTLSHTGNTIIVDFDDTILGAKGVCKLKIALYASNQLLSSFPFLIRVDENVYDENGIIITPEYSELEEALKKVEDIETKEIARVEAENKRVSSEQTRNNAESTRQKSEQSRVTAETNRVSAESTRKTNETNRKTNETARVSAESTRNTSEDNREKNETKREESEQARVKTETTRETNESNRKTNESARIENENKRISAESDRNNAEIERGKAEESRVSSENERRNSEASRVSDFTNMKNELSEIVENNKNINIEAITPDDEHYQVKVTDKNGVSKTSANLLSKLSIGTVETGEYNEDPTVNITGKFGEQKLNFRLPIGKPFKIKKTYSSIADMNQNIDTDLELYEFCMINTGNVEDEDTAKLYMREINGAQYITDLSGAQGIQGIKGETGATPNLTIGTVTTGTEGSQATATISGTAENPILNLTIPRGMTGKVENISGASIPYASSDDEKSIKDVVDRIDTTIAEKAPITHTHTTVNGHTVESDVPSNAVFTDTNTWRPQPDWNATSGDAMIKNKPTIGNAASKTVRTLTTVGDSGWTGSVATEQQHVPDMAFMAYWNGAYKGTASNLLYCNKGAFGSIVTKNIGDYAASNHTHTIDSALSSTSTNPVQNKVVNTAIEEVKKSVSDGKSTVASAITNMGVSTASDATFATMATNVKKIFPTPAQFAAKYKNVFRTLATAPVNFNGATAICYGKQIFVHGSCASGGDFKSMYCYDIVNNTWAKMASSPVEHQWQNTAVLVGDSILYFGNWTGTSINLYQYNISWNNWTNRNVSIPIAAQGGAAFFQGGAIRLLSSQYTNYKNNYYYYSLITNTFTQGANLTAADAADIYGCTSSPITVGDKVYLISYASAKIKIFHVGNFKTVEDIVAPGRSFGCSTKVGNLIYIACTKYSTSPYIFNMNTKTFTGLSNTNHSGQNAGCVNFGDEVFYIGSSTPGHENKATNIHTTFCLDNLY